MRHRSRASQKLTSALFQLHDLYAALRSLGRHGVADLVDRCCAHAHAFASGAAFHVAVAGNSSMPGGRLSA